MAEKKYIECEAAYKALEEADSTFNISMGAFNFLSQLLSEIPAADVQPVVRGKWVDEPIKGIRYYCSVCQGRFDYTWNYCPNCGADMRG